MSAQKNIDIAQRFLEKLGAGESPEAIAAMFSADLDWHVPGSQNIFPWVGHRTGRAAVADFVRESGKLIERLKLEVHDVLASEHRAVIVGELATRVKATGKTIETAYAIVLTIQDDQITHFLMLEDSFAVAAAASL